MKLTNDDLRGMLERDKAKQSTDHADLTVAAKRAVIEELLQLRISSQDGKPKCRPSGG